MFNIKFASLSFLVKGKLEKILPNISSLIFYDSFTQISYLVNNSYFILHLETTHGFVDSPTISWSLFPQAFGELSQAHQ